MPYKISMHIVVWRCGQYDPQNKWDSHFHWRHKSDLSLTFGGWEI